MGASGGQFWSVLLIYCNYMAVTHNIYLLYILKYIYYVIFSGRQCAKDWGGDPLDVFDPREVRGKMIIDNQNDNNNQDDNDYQDDQDNQ